MRPSANNIMKDSNTNSATEDMNADIFSCDICVTT